jgi:hypothetical protein
MADLKSIMKRAWNIFRAMSSRMSFANALRSAWAWARGDRFAFEVAYVDWDYSITRKVGFGRTYDEAIAARVQQTRDMLAKGLRAHSSVEISLKIYA